MANQTQVNRLEKPVVTGISDWLNINQYTYDYSKVSILKDQIASNITPYMTVLQIYRVIRDEIAAWRKNPKTSADRVIRKINSKAPATPQQVQQLKAIQPRGH